MANASLIDSYLTDQFYLDMRQRLRGENFTLDAERVVIRERLAVIEQETSKQTQFEDGYLERLNDAVSLYRAALAPIRNIPVEILRHIFEDTQENDSRVVDTDNPPWSLKHTCKRWYDIVVSHPILWSEVNVNLKYDMLAPTVELLETFLSHSGTCPLSVKLVWNPGEDAPEEWVDVVAALVEHSSHWKHFEVTYGEYFEEAGLPGFLALRDIKGRLPLLETLQVIGDRSVDFSGAFEDAFMDAPALRTVEVYGRYTGPEFALPWSQLQTVRVEAATADDFFDILKQTPNITKCTQSRDNGDSYYPKIPDGRPPITLHHLEQLEVINGTILDYITAPALHSLTLRTLPRAIPLLPRFLQRSNCQLTFLDLFVTDHTNSEQVITILKDTLTLKSLALDFTARSDARPVIAQLSLAESPLLPHLESLRLAVRDSVPDDLIWQLVEFRSQLRMCKFDMHFFFDLDETILARLRVLRADGVEIKMMTRDTSASRWIIF